MFNTHKKLYVNFIGTDGSGKDTIFDMIKEQFPDALLTREPGGTPEAEIIREVILSNHLSQQERIEKIQDLLTINVNPTTADLLKKSISTIKKEGISNAEPFLYAASRSESLNDSIIPALKEGRPVLGRRSAACSVAYQGSARGFGMNDIWELNEPIIRDAHPTLEIFFDLPIPVAMERLAGRTEKQDRLDVEGEVFFEKVREGYLTYYKTICPYPFRIVDATKSIEEVYEDVKSILLEYMD